MTAYLKEVARVLGFGGTVFDSQYLFVRDKPETSTITLTHVHARKTNEMRPTPEICCIEAASSIRPFGSPFSSRTGNVGRARKNTHARTLTQSFKSGNCEVNLPGIIYRAGTANRCRSAIGHIRYTT